MNNDAQKRCGFIALVGRPNVGKSTLLNHLIGQKLSITSRKPQTTRHRLLGIKSANAAQLIFVDTPGLHITPDSDRALNRFMNKTVSAVIRDVDVVVFMVDGVRWTEADQRVLEQLEKVKVPVILVLNKSDKLEDKESLLPAIKARASEYPYAEILPVSALGGHNLEKLEETLIRYLPEGDFMFPEDQITDRNSRFIAAEFIREKITRQLGKEVPYGVTVEIEEFAYDEQGLLHISGLILVEREGQKKIIIGNKGERLKLIGVEARKDLERLFDSRIMLSLWVKVRSGWSDDERALKSLGYFDDQG